MSSSTQTGQRPAAASPQTAGRRWLLLVHQLPSTPSNLRVRTWRRLQQLGAIPVKQAVYVLPDTPGTREDFEWLKSEIKAAGGDASVFAADSVDTWSDAALVEEFRRSGQEAYTALARDVERILRRLANPRRAPGTRAPALRRLAAVFRERFTSIEHVDFFAAAGRDRASALLKQLEAQTSDQKRPAASKPGSATRDTETYRRRVWATRPRPGVDRMATAWLIRRFVDPEARFAFAADRESLPLDTIPFDMFGVEFSHQGEGCTFETLCAVFGLQEPALVRIAGIVHDLDLKDGRFGAPEAPAVGAIIEGLHLSHGDDDALLAQGITLFESLYRAFERSARVAGPRPVARSRSRSSSPPGRKRTGPR